MCNQSIIVIKNKYLNKYCELSLNMFVIKCYHELQRSNHNYILYPLKYGNNVWTAVFQLVQFEFYLVFVLA